MYGESRLRRPIEAKADNDETTLPHLARLNYGEKFEVRHTEPVHCLGHILEEAIDRFVTDYEIVQSLLQAPSNHSLPTTDNLRSFLRPQPLSPNIRQEPVHLVMPPANYPRPRVHFEQSPQTPTQPPIPTVALGITDSGVSDDIELGEVMRESGTALEHTGRPESAAPVQEVPDPMGYLVETESNSADVPPENDPFPDTSDKGEESWEESGSKPSDHDSQDMEQGEPEYQSEDSDYEAMPQPSSTAEEAAHLVIWNETQNTDYEADPPIGANSTAGPDQEIGEQNVSEPGIPRPEMETEGVSGDHSHPVGPITYESVSEEEDEEEKEEEEDKDKEEEVEPFPGEHEHDLPPHIEPGEQLGSWKDIFAQYAVDEGDPDYGETTQSSPNEDNVASLEPTRGEYQQTYTREEETINELAPEEQQHFTPPAQLKDTVDGAHDDVVDVDLVEPSGLLNTDESQNNGVDKTLPTSTTEDDGDDSIGTPEQIQPELDAYQPPSEEAGEDFVDSKAESPRVPSEFSSWQFPAAEISHSNDSPAVASSVSEEIPQGTQPRNHHDETPAEPSASEGPHLWDVYVTFSGYCEHRLKIPGPRGIQPQVKCTAAQTGRQDSLDAETPTSSAHSPSLSEGPIADETTGPIAEELEETTCDGAVNDSQEKPAPTRPILEVVTDLPGSFPSEPKLDTHETSQNQHDSSPTEPRNLSPKTDQPHDSEAEYMTDDDPTSESDNERADSHQFPATSPDPTSSQTSYESQASKSSPSGSHENYSQNGRQSRSNTIPTSVNDRGPGMQYPAEYYNHSYYTLQGQNQQPVFEQSWPNQFSTGSPYQAYPAMHSAHPNFPSSTYYAPAEHSYPAVQLPVPPRPFPMNMQHNYTYGPPMTHAYMQPQPSTPIGNFGLGPGPQFPINQPHHSHHHPQQHQQQQPHTFSSTPRSGGETPSGTSGRFEMDLIFFDDHYTRMEPLRALLDTGASLNFISEEKARVVGLILLPHLGQDIELANGHRIRPRYNVSARWRPFRNSGTIWTDRFVVLSEMGGRDVIIGSEILENRLFLLGKNELNVLGLPKLSKRMSDICKALLGRSELIIMLQ